PRFFSLLILLLCLPSLLQSTSSDMYDQLPRKLDTPYPMEVDTPYQVIDQNRSDVQFDKAFPTRVLDMGVLGVSWNAHIRRIFLDGYNVLVVRRFGSNSSYSMLTLECTKAHDGQLKKDHDQQGNDLLTDNRGSDLYTNSIQETTSSTPICLMAKASPTQAWLWNRRLFHLNFDHINLLSKKDVVIGLPKLKYVKDQLCSSCEVIKSKRSSFKTKVVQSSKGRQNLLHLNLCGPMRSNAGC
ncbi:retrovirus-related pol polyprotein from transposon TNT 1-94, partial [Tanacetum coccineum]